MSILLYPLMDETRPWYKTKSGIVFLTIFGFIAGIAILFLSMVGYYSWTIKYGDADKLAARFSGEFTTISNFSSTASKDLSKEEMTAMIRPENPSLGSKNAKITILAFIDFECPYSQKSFSIFKDISSTYAPVTKIVFKNFPIEELHPDSRMAAMAAACAQKQNVFWPYYDSLFTYKKLDTESFLQYAKSQKLNTVNFESCLRKEQTAQIIEKDFADGVAAGVRGTPTYFVNGLKIEGVISKETWDAILSQELKNN